MDWPRHQRIQQLRQAVQVPAISRPCKQAARPCWLLPASMKVMMISLQMASLRGQV